MSIHPRDASNKQGLKLDIEKNRQNWEAHCKGTFPREFAYKPLSGESPLNLVRIHRVRDIEALAGLVSAYHNRLGFYVSVYPFVPKPGSGKLDYETAIIDRLYLDFDSAENLGLALDESSTIRDALQDVSIEAMYYFSGLKGTACYIDFSPAAIAVENKKEVLGLFWDIVNEGMEMNYTSLKLTTLDRSSVRGDIARVSRLPNTPHHSGLFCIPLTIRDMHRSESYIRNFARQPRYDIDLDIIIKDNIKINDKVVPDLLRKLELRVIDMRKEKEEEREARAAQLKAPPAAARGGKYVTEEEIQKARSYPIANILGNRKLRTCPFHDDQVPSLSVNHKKNLWRCFACFPPGSLIKTETGLQPIESIVKGQRVLTHMGRYMPVIATKERPYKGDLLHITVRKSGEVLTLTSDHKVYVMKSEHCVYKSRSTRICQWNCKKKCGQRRRYPEYHIEKIPARELSVDDFLLYPIDQMIEDVDVIDLNKHCNRRSTRYGKPIRDMHVEVNEDFLRLIGYYIAEGSPNRGYIRFSIGCHEDSFAKDIISLNERVFHIRGGVHFKKNESGIDISVCNSKLPSILKSMCGEGAENKHIPFEFQHLPPAKQRILLEAVLRGDGNTDRRRKNLEHKITTISYTLAQQLRDILLRLGKRPSLNIQIKRRDKNGVNHKQAYSVRWQEDSSQGYSYFYRDVRSGVAYWLVPIKRVSTEYHEGKVHNLTVLEDHSYIATCSTVSNCGRSGNVIQLVMGMEGISFTTAVRWLCSR
jgi:intein/homing endonuclease